MTALKAIGAVARFQLQLEAIPDLEQRLNRFSRHRFAIRRAGHEPQAFRGARHCRTIDGLHIAHRLVQPNAMKHDSAPDFAEACKRAYLLMSSQDRYNAAHCGVADGWTGPAKATLVQGVLVCLALSHTRAAAEKKRNRDRAWLRVGLG